VREKPVCDFAIEITENELGMRCDVSSVFLVLSFQLLIVAC
jgi:hypothetical protein